MLLILAPVSEPDYHQHNIFWPADHSSVSLSHNRHTRSRGSSGGGRQEPLGKHFLSDAIFLEKEPKRFWNSVDMNNVRLFVFFSPGQAWLRCLCPGTRCWSLATPGSLDHNTWSGSDLAIRGAVSTVTSEGECDQGSGDIRHEGDHRGDSGPVCPDQPIISTWQVAERRDNIRIKQILSNIRSFSRIKEIRLFWKLLDKWNVILCVRAFIWNQMSSYFSVPGHVVPGLYICILLVLLVFLRLMLFCYWAFGRSASGNRSSYFLGNATRSSKMIWTSWDCYYEGFRNREVGIWMRVRGGQRSLKTQFNCGALSVSMALTRSWDWFRCSGVQKEQRILSCAIYFFDKLNSSKRQERLFDNGISQSLVKLFVSYITSFQLTM